MQHPFSNKALISWLEKQPAEKEYHYCRAYGCLLYTYLKEAGLPVKNVVAFEWKDSALGQYHRLPKGWNEVAQGLDDYTNTRWTYGAAARRARRLLDVH